MDLSSVSVAKCFNCFTGINQPLLQLLSILVAITFRFFIVMAFTRDSSLNESDSQRIEIVLAIIGLDRRNQQEYQV